MINCPHCGGELASDPEGFEKLSPQQARIFRLFLNRPTRIWTNEDIVNAIYANRRNGGPTYASDNIAVQIYRIRKHIGNVIETTKSGYRLRLSELSRISGKSTTESEAK
jgi:DNA-binding response OmpR family regulator